jgi:hypothetical protein
MMPVQAASRWKPASRRLAVAAIILTGVSLWSPAGMSAETESPAAGPVITVNVRQDSVTKHDVIYAEAAYETHGEAVVSVISAISGYAGLHSWITETELVYQSDSDRQEFHVEFRFPWPVGRKWSRIRVQREADRRISWYQLDGSLGRNEGHLALELREQHAQINYQAVIDVGLPDAWTRTFKQKFVREFLMAVYDHAALAGEQTGLQLASTSD